MKNELSAQVGTEREGVREHLIELREALLRLHKALMESERTGYEKTFGRVASPYQLLHLLTTDPWFMWLRPVSQLVAAMDEMLDANEPLTASVVDALAVQAKTLLVPLADGRGFSGHYDEALQRDPDVVFAHAAMARLFRVPSRKTAAL